MKLDIPKQIIAVCHFKGGVGGSFIASNIALMLAKNNILTCLIDFDTKLPNCANILGIEIKKKHSMYRYFSNNNPDIRGDFFISDSKNVSPNLYLISSSSEDEVEILEDINDNGTDVDDLLEVAKETFDIVVVDLPVDYQNPQVIGTLQKADKVLVVGDMDINTIENTFRSLQLYKSLDIPLSKFTYITNKFFQNKDVKVSTIQDTLGIRAAVTVPNDFEAVYDSVIKSKPLIDTKHKVGSAIKEICGLITGNIVFDNSSNSTKEELNPNLAINAAKEEVAPAKLNLVFDEEGEKPDGSSKG